MGNELGQGGVGDCRGTDVPSYGAEGTWPAFMDTWLEYFATNVNRRNIPLVSPTIEAQSNTTFGVEMETAWADYWTMFDLLSMNLYESDVSGYPENLRTKLQGFSDRFLGIPGRNGGLVLPEFGVSSDWGGGLTDEQKSDHLATALSLVAASPAVSAAGIYATVDPDNTYGVRPWPRS